MNKTPHIKRAFRFFRQTNLGQMPGDARYPNPSSIPVPTHTWGQQPQPHAMPPYAQGHYPQAPSLPMGAPIEQNYTNHRRLAALGAGGSGGTFWNDFNPDSIKNYLKNALLFLDSYPHYPNYPTYTVTVLAYKHSPEPLVLIEEAKDYAQALINTARLFDIYQDKKDLTIMSVTYYSQYDIHRISAMYGNIRAEEGVLALAWNCVNAGVPSAVVILSQPETESFEAQYKIFLDNFSSKDVFIPSSLDEVLSNDDMREEFNAWCQTYIDEDTGAEDAFDMYLRHIKNTQGHTGNVTLKDLGTESSLFTLHVAEASIEEVNTSGELELLLIPFAQSLESVLDQIRNLGTDCEEEDEDELYQELVEIVKAKVLGVQYQLKAPQSNHSLDVFFSQK